MLENDSQRTVNKYDRLNLSDHNEYFRLNASVLTRIMKERRTYLLAGNQQSGG